MSRPVIAEQRDDAALGALADLRHAMRRLVILEEREGAGRNLWPPGVTFGIREGGSDGLVVLVDSAAQIGLLFAVADSVVKGHEVRLSEDRIMAKSQDSGRSVTRSAVEPKSGLGKALPEQFFA